MLKLGHFAYAFTLIEVPGTVLTNEFFMVILLAYKFEDSNFVEGKVA